MVVPNLTPCSYVTEDSGTITVESTISTHPLDVDNRVLQQGTLLRETVGNGLHVVEHDVSELSIYWQFLPQHVQEVVIRGRCIGSDPACTEGGSLNGRSEILRSSHLLQA